MANDFNIYKAAGCLGNIVRKFGHYIILLLFGWLINSHKKKK